ncbi:uncharacterized protein ASCRUDRAFT_13965 [Ascoidea rubescens DSM 1968]|uniref:Uncharacterized protein n=1 Tax=Ascoidea rubescens DSM 1968 TaxID=1344418 RepID=A0A1D2VFM2_9ASCO|nr:hypothetical protein ASCRUDRAFT_13965 [Ascoidea rubescens DSM 1968]ODV60313.1 hypothetical protein ASCRUDRAFT_13965 [Ascoidea rubescens DSM 1968]
MKAIKFRKKVLRKASSLKKYNDYLVTQLSNSFSKLERQIKPSKKIPPLFQKNPMNFQNNIIRAPTVIKVCNQQHDPILSPKLSNNSTYSLSTSSLNKSSLLEKIERTVSENLKDLNNELIKKHNNQHILNNRLFSFTPSPPEKKEIIDLDVGSNGNLLPNRREILFMLSLVLVDEGAEFHKTQNNRRDEKFENSLLLQTTKFLDDASLKEK